MKFFKSRREGISDTDMNDLDQVTMNIAKSLSRRGFLRKLGSLGLGAGFGVAGVGTALANCGNCGMGGCQRHTCGYNGGRCYVHDRCLDLCNNYCDRFSNYPCTGC